MDRELASAVFQRWTDGLPVAETAFHKAASVIGIDPDDALLEARFYTMLDADLRKLASCESIPESAVLAYSAAAGYGPQELVKTASAFQLDPLELALKKLASENWVPNLAMLKLAIMAPAMGGQDMGGGQMDPAQAAMQPPGAGGPAGAAPPPMPPQPGAAVQQAPEERYRPSPMAPAQTPPSEEGNMQELVDAARHPDQGAEMGPEAGMGPGGAPSMGSEQGPAEQPPMPPEEKIMQVAPDVPQERLPEYAAKLQELESNVGMPVQDPAQITKFVAQMKKEDGKKIDEAIKQMGTQPPLTASKKPAEGEQGASSEAPSPATPAAPEAEKVAGVPPQFLKTAASLFVSSGGTAALQKVFKQIHSLGLNTSEAGKLGYMEGLKKGLVAAGVGTGVGTGVGYGLGRKSRKAKESKEKRASAKDQAINRFAKIMTRMGATIDDPKKIPDATEMLRANFVKKMKERGAKVTIHK